MVEVRGAEVSTYCHSTEDCSKVIQAMKNILPEEFREKVSINKQIVHGYYGNPIEIYSIKLDNSVSDVFFKSILSRMSREDRALLALTLKLRYEASRGRLYVRLSKQDAYAGRVVLLESDDVIKTVFHLKTRVSLKELEDYIKSFDKG
ncbi:MAG: RNA-binding domain-containing protein [Desulfurococcaceae archaeon]|uniref:Exosome protein n=1 Tax=Staphylothermus marinus TaxID=2280 RepID=A0A7C4NRI0_STAMA